VLYRKRGSTWALTEARAESVERSADSFALSSSRIQREGDSLLVHLDERTAPWGRPLRGRVRIDIEHGAPGPYRLDQAGDHHWWPIGARASAEVELDTPAVRFRGSAYHDCNFGQVPLEQTFESWNWSRANVGGDVYILYDVQEHDAAGAPLGLRLRPEGVEALSTNVAARLPRGFWGMEGSTRAHGQTQVIRTLEDTPFYTRSLLQTSFDGQDCVAMHESLSMTKFVKPWVQFLLPFRIRRGWRA